MDYSQYKTLEFRRKYFKILGAAISIFPANSDTLIGYIKMKAWNFRGDIRVFTDKSMQQEIVRIGGRQIISLQKLYDIFDSASGNKLVTVKQRSLRSIFIRNHMDILDANGNDCGYVQETSSTLALVRRWIGLFPYVGIITDLVLAFVPQTFDVMKLSASGEPQLAGKIVHRKNPIVVKMSLDTSNAQASFDMRISIAVVSLLSILDAVKNR
jgi:hypothetical protein